MSWLFGAKKASQSKVGSKTKQELLEYINNVRVVITDHGLNRVHVFNDDNKGSSTEVMISDSVKLTGRRMHCNDTFVVASLWGGGGKGGYMIGNVDDFTKNQSKIVNLSYGVIAIFITNDNKVALGGTNGEVQFDQVDVNGKQTMIWCKKIHDCPVNDIKVHNNKIFTASSDNKCGVITMSDGSVLHMFNAPDWLFCVCVVNDDVILTGCDDGKVYRHDMSTTTTSVFVTPGRSESILTLELSNDYNILYCGGGDKTLYAINMKTNNTLLWKTKCEHWIFSICVQYGIICVGVHSRNVVCVNEHSGEIITKLTIKPQDTPWSIVMIPPNTPKALTASTPTPTTTIATPSQQITVASAAPNPSPTPITVPVDLHKQYQEQIQQLTQERDAIKQIANQEVQQAQQQIIQPSQQLETANQLHAQQIKQVQFQHQQSQFQLQQAQQQIDQLSQQETLNRQRIVELETENNKFRQDQARDQLNSLITKINNLSGPEVIQIANVFNINLTGVDATKLATANMIAHSSFDEFFDDSNADVVFHDSLLRLYSLIKKAQEIGQFPVEHPVAPWIAQQGQPDIAARFDELNYTEEMMVCMDAKVFASKYDFKPHLIKTLQADFIVSQTSFPGSTKPDTSSGGVMILLPFNSNSPKPSASSSSS